MRRTTAALLLAFALLPAACGRDENEQGSPDGSGQTDSEREQAPETTTTE